MRHEIFKEKQQSWGMAKRDPLTMVVVQLWDISSLVGNGTARVPLKGKLYGKQYD
jgi:hypothetical protein